MPLFIMIGTDSAQGRALRKEHRPAHLANLEPLARAGRITYGGPTLDAEGLPTGSVVIFEAESLQAARAIADSDPYLEQGVFERVEVFETRQVFPAAP